MSNDPAPHDDAAQAQLAQDRITRALYDSLMVFYGYYGEKIANAGDKMAVAQAKAATEAYKAAYPAGLLPGVDASRVLP